MKRLLLALALFLLPAAASAQCNGVFPANKVCGTLTGGVPSPQSPATFQGSAGGTNGQLQINSGGALAGINAVTNAQITAGAANTMKGSLNGSATSDIALVSCSAAYRFTQWVTGTGWQCGISPIIPSRAIASGLNLSAFTAITVQGYATAGDGGFMTMALAASQPFCANFTNTAAFQDTGTNWWNIAEPGAYNTKQFGAKVDASTDDAAATQSAIYCAALTFQPGQISNTGANGRRVLLPAGISNIGSTIIVPQGVIVEGQSTFASTFAMTTGFAANAHFFILGEQFQQTDIAQAQTAGGAGSLILNGNRVRSGAAYTLYANVVQICSANNNNTTTFTVTGINGATGLSDTDVITGPAGGFCTLGVKFFRSITSITSSAGYSNITVGYQQVATFSARLQDLQLFSTNTNATQFATFINNAPGGALSGTTGTLGNAMVYTNSIQHTGGIQRVKILSGNRSGTLMETGVGGASLFLYEDVEIGFVGNCGGCASNNPGAYFNYGGLLSPINRLVIYNFSNFAGSVAVNISGGFISFTNSHCENTPTCWAINTASVNAGATMFQNILGAPTVTDLILINGGVTTNTTYAAAIYGGGATHTINNKGTNTTGNVIPWTQY